MSVTVHLPGPLRPFNEGRPTAVVDAEATVGDALRALPAGVRERILDERGELRMHVNVFVGETSVRETGGLATPVPGGTEVFVIPAVSGGEHEVKVAAERAAASLPGWSDPHSAGAA